MHNEEVLPYLIIKGRVEWNIPYSEALLSDFLRTHHINDKDGFRIVTGMPLSGGLGLPEITELWDMAIKYVVPILSIPALIEGVLALKDRMKKTISKQRIPTPLTISEFILSKGKWNYHDLARFLGLYEQSEIAKGLLKLLGYKWDPRLQMYVITKDCSSKAKKILHEIEEAISA
jgi:hypothetical protein